MNKIELTYENGQFVIPKSVYDVAGKILSDLLIYGYTIKVSCEGYFSGSIRTRIDDNGFVTLLSDGDKVSVYNDVFVKLVEYVSANNKITLPIYAKIKNSPFRFSLNGCNTIGSVEILHGKAMSNETNEDFLRTLVDYVSYEGYGKNYLNFASDSNHRIWIKILAKIKDSEKVLPVKLHFSNCCFRFNDLQFIDGEILHFGEVVGGYELEDNDPYYDEDERIVKHIELYQIEYMTLMYEKVNA